MLSIGKQLRKPSGFFGRVVAKMMDSRNKTFYKKIISELELKNGDRIYEIGYGPGMGINMILNTQIDCKLYGIDFSELMYKQATKRNIKYVENGVVNIKFGDFLNENPIEKYDKIYCVNVVYFWADLKFVFSKIHSMLNTEGLFCIFMYHKDFFENREFAKDFQRHSIESVEQNLKEAGFSTIDYKLDGGYYVKAKK